MHIFRIYTPQPLSQHTSIKLEAAAAHHIRHVLRMKPGCELILFNGQGGEFKAVLSIVEKKTVRAELKQFVDRTSESPLRVELGGGLIKSNNMSWLLQKATELGVTSITPLLSEYTDVKLPVDKVDKKLLHWQQVVMRASNQSVLSSQRLLCPKDCRHGLKMWALTRN